MIKTNALSVPTLLRGVALASLVFGLSGLFMPQASQAESLSAPAPVVVELFTAQGCRSCPEADAYLTELAAEPDLLVLSYHLDYWDYVGWPDPHALSAAKQRQRAYGEGFGLRYAYTPQMVIQGSTQVAGSMRDDVDAAITAARSQNTAPAAYAVTIRNNPATRGLLISVGQAAEGEGAKVQGDEPVQVWLIRYSLRAENEVTAGENAGMRAVNSHVVREIRRLGVLDEGQASYAADRPDGSEGLAVLVQPSPMGPILGSASVTLLDLNDAETAQR